MTVTVRIAWDRDEARLRLVEATERPLDACLVGKLNYVNERSRQNSRVNLLKLSNRVYGYRCQVGNEYLPTVILSNGKFGCLDV